MRRRIAGFFDPVAFGGEDVPMRIGDYGTDRHLAPRAGGLGLGQRSFHGGIRPDHRNKLAFIAGPGLAPFMSKRPVIGLTLDSEEPGGYSKFPWYAMRRNYAAAVAAAGGLPMALPHLAHLADQYLDTVDGLIVTGGAFDVDPALYGDATMHDTVSLKQGRTAAELALLRGALARDMPVLGICGGQQLLAVALGGSLIQHIADAVPEALAHEQPNPRDEPGHEVALQPGTVLARIVGAPLMQVNSSHHQAVAAATEAYVVNATAPDLVIEGIEAPERKFCIGVQWHPEFLIDPGDARLFAAFIDACR